MFDLSAQFHPKKNKKTPKPPQPPSNPSPAPPPTSTDIDSSFKQMRLQQKELQDQLDDLFNKSGLSRSAFENPANFSKTAWTHLQAKKEALEAAIHGMSLEELRKSKVVINAGKETKKRKGKTLGSRHRWLDMH